MDYYDYNRQYGGNSDENSYDYTKPTQATTVPQMYTQMPQVMPNFVPLPMMTMRPGAEMDYSRWIAPQNYPQYQVRYIDPMQYQRTLAREMEQTTGNGGYGGSTKKEEVLEHNEEDSPTSPRYGPGPPIVTSDRVKGPRGCNLFVFHLPNEITNWDLYLLFRRFGTLLSVHTMINKTTGLSKGYGFVSYSAREEAKAAIAAMDGFRLGKKRLKVQVKRSQEDHGEDGDVGGADEENGNEEDVNLPEEEEEQAAAYFPHEKQQQQYVAAAQHGEGDSSGGDEAAASAGHKQPSTVTSSANPFYPPPPPRQQTRQYPNTAAQHFKSAVDEQVAGVELELEREAEKVYGVHTQQQASAQQQQQQSSPLKRPYPINTNPVMPQSSSTGGGNGHTSGDCTSGSTTRASTPRTAAMTPSAASKRYGALTSEVLQTQQSYTVQQSQDVRDPSSGTTTPAHSRTSSLTQGLSNLSILTPMTPREAEAAIRRDPNFLTQSPRNAQGAGLSYQVPYIAPRQRGPPVAHPTNKPQV